MVKIIIQKFAKMCLIDKMIKLGSFMEEESWKSKADHMYFGGYKTHLKIQESLV